MNEGIEDFCFVFLSTFIHRHVVPRMRRCGGWKGIRRRCAREHVHEFANARFFKQGAMFMKPSRDQCTANAPGSRRPIRDTFIHMAAPRRAVPAPGNESKTKCD